MAVDGQPVPAAIFDFALYFFHNAKELLKRDTGAFKPTQLLPCICLYMMTNAGAPSWGASCGIFHRTPTCKA